MSAWRRQALAVLPQFRSLIDRATGPMALWIELELSFNRAVSGGDRDVVQRILSFARWCSSEGSGPLPNDTSTAVSCAFYEHLLTRREYWPHMRSWFPPEVFRELLPTFGYHLSAVDVAELKKLYQRQLL